MPNLSLKKIATSMLAVTLIALVLVLIAVFVLPKVLQAALPELSDPGAAVRLALWGIILLYVVWMGVLGVIRLYAAWELRQARGDGIPQALHEQLAQVRAEFGRAAQQLRRGWIKDSSGAGGAILLLGEPGAGKSAALEGSQLSLRLLDAQGTHYSGRHGRLCALVRCEQAVVIDTDGSLGMAPERRPVWMELLQQLRAHSEALPLSAVVVVVSLERLQGPTGLEVARQQAARLRGMLDDVAREVGVTPPVHVLFTHLDVLPGFVDALGAGAVREAGAFGRSFPSDTRAAASLRSHFLNLLGELLSAVEARRPVALPYATPTRWAAALLFPGQLRASGAAMATVIHGLSERQGAMSGLPIAGFWLSSATQGRVSTAGVELELDRRFGLVAPAGQDLGSTGGAAPGPLFLRGLFADVLTRPFEGVRLDAEEVSRRGGRVRRAAALAAFGVGLSGALVGAYGLAGIRALKLVEAQTEALQSALADSSGGVEPAGLDSLMVILDLAGIPWSATDQASQEALLGWAWSDTGHERPGWLRRKSLAVVRWGLGPGAATLGKAYTEARLVLPAQRLLRDEVKGLEVGAPGELLEVSAGQPLPAHLREWATSAWIMSDLVVRWRRLRSEAAGEEDQEALRLDVATGIVELVEKLREQGESVDSPGAIPIAERELLIRWLAETDETQWRSGLPTQDATDRLLRRLQPVEARHLLFAVALEAAPPPGSLHQRAGLLRSSGGRALTAGPPGFTPAACGAFERGLDEHIQQGTFKGYRGGNAGQLDSAQVLADYRGAHAGAWEEWLEGLTVSVERLPQSPGPLAVSYEDVFRLGGDLDRLIALAGAPPPGEGAEAGASAESGKGAESEDCQCLRESLWMPVALGPGGAARAELEALQIAMDAVAQDLRALAQDGDARRARVQETLTGRGVVADAAAATERLGRAMRGLPPPAPRCAGLDTSELRNLNDLWAARIEALSYQLLNAGWRWLAREYEQDAERAWSTEVLPEWQRLRGRYPLARRSSEELSAEELSALFGAGGMVDSFTNLWLAPLVTGSQMRRPAWPGAPTLELTTTALGLVQGRGGLNRTIEAIGQEWNVALSCGRQPRCAPQTVTLVQVMLDGELALVQDYMGRSEPAQRRVRVDTAWQVSAKELQSRDRECLTMKGEGSWALFRLLDNGGGSGVVTLSDGSCALLLGLSESTGGPRATLTALRRLAVPERLFVPVTVQ